MGLELRFLGDLAVHRDGVPLSLPPSKKTRALLPYLALSDRPQRRERLCALLWDVPDDPRGALRWSLSKLRSLVDGDGTLRIVADRETVRFDASGVWIDVVAVRAALRDAERLDVPALAGLAVLFQGEFLEGLVLPDCHAFQAWCVAEREDLRVSHARLLRLLLDRLADSPDRALPYARTLSQVEPADESAQAGLARLLDAVGRRREAEAQLQAADRLLDDLGADRTGALARARRDLRPVRRAGPAPVPAAPATATPSHAGATPTASGLVGRAEERTALLTALDDCAGGRRRVVLLTGEPGIGKSRLLGELKAAARLRRATLLDGAAYEAEIDQPYGPWVDALRALPAVAIGETLGAGLSPLLPELAAGDEGRSPPAGRERLFGAVAELVAARAHVAPPVVVVLDDIQWCDAASASLLHYVARMNLHRPVLIALAARAGELPDNEPMLGVIRALRRDPGFAEIVLAPLDAETTAVLVASLFPAADRTRIVEESGGNPLFAIEAARAGGVAETAVPRTLAGLVRDRVDRLPSEAAEILRWSAVLGPTFEWRRLAALAPVDAESLSSALEMLERHALLRVADREDGEGRRSAYAFAHDVVHRAVYGELSEPRRRLMHLRVAEALTRRAADGEDNAAELAHHAALAGESALAARACVAAGRRCLRLFANAEAHALARRGEAHARHLDEPERTCLSLELMDIALAARRPADGAAAARELEALAERALDHGRMEHARLGFHLLSHLRWEGGAWSAARHDSMRAELVSRSADDHERVVAMGEAARCLVLLEHDLPQAESLVLEARALGRRAGIESSAVPAAQGMLCLHRGEFDEAAELLRQARLLARREGGRLGEFHALEYAVLLELQRDDLVAADVLAADLCRLGSRLREGSEGPFASALAASVRMALAKDDDGSTLDAALDALREADAKHRLALALMAAAEADLGRGDVPGARRRAGEALEMADAMNRRSETVAARLMLVRVSLAEGDRAAARRQLDDIDTLALAAAAAPIRDKAHRLRTDIDRLPAP